MTEQDILAMVPGPELDSLVMTQVMGITMSMVLSKPHYSTDIAAAFEAIDKMISLGWNLHIHSGWGEFEVYFDNDDGKVIRTNCKTIPEAASKAALLAIMDLEG